VGSVLAVCLEVWDPVLGGEGKVVSQREKLMARRARALCSGALEIWTTP